MTSPSSLPPSLPPSLPGIAVESLLEPAQENVARQFERSEDLVLEGVREGRREDVAGLLQESGGEMAEVEEGVRGLKEEWKEGGKEGGAGKRDGRVGS
jgi:hypothetical protein